VTALAALRHRPLLLQSALLGLAVGAALHGFGVTLPRSVLLGWCAATLAWLAMLLPRLRRHPPEALRTATAALDEGTWPMLGATVAAALASLGAVVWEFAQAARPAPALTLALGLGTVMLSWAFVHVLFALHYAHEHWRRGEGVVFPGNATPGFDEFLYFAFTVGMTFQVSDATTTTPVVRRLVVVHGLVSFLFNAVILGAAVNLAAALAR
jgi:uncharacterized membrane protein